MDPIQQQFFEDLYRQHYEELVHIANKHSYNRQDSEDLVQEAFYKLLVHQSRFEHINNTPKFLRTVIYNEFVDQLRKKLRGQEYRQRYEWETETSAHLTEQYMDARELDVLVQQAILQLSPQRRRIFVLGKLEGRSRYEITSLLGIAEGTARESMRLAIKDVKGYIQKHTGGL
jgi:RNA polymerase sigma factor (sigma-70 family)